MTCQGIYDLARTCSSAVRQAQKQTVASKRTSAMRTTAQLIRELEKKYSDFGGGEWGAQMTKMIDGEPELKAEYEALKGK